MNPNKWKWYTYVMMLVIAWQVVMIFITVAGGFYPSLAYVPWGGLLFSTVALWFTLWLIHEIVRAFYLALTGKMPPPIDRPH